MVNTSSLKCPVSFIPFNIGAVESQYLLTSSVGQVWFKNSCYNNSLGELYRGQSEKKGMPYNNVMRSARPH